MKFKLIFATIFSLTVFLTLINFAYTSDSSGPWFNSSWHFRVPINITNSTQAVINASVKVNINFTSLLNQLGITGTFDPNSIRVLEDGYEHPHDWENETLTKGNVSWIANGTTLVNTNRTFWIYFDIMENGAKPKGKIISEKPYWSSGYTGASMDVWSNQSESPGIGYEWNRTEWAQSLEVSWRWCAGTYSNAYLYVNGAQVRVYGNAIGSEVVLFQGSKLAARFYSLGDDKRGGTCTGYGTAVDWIKFYETANYTTPILISYIGNPEAQPLSVTVQTDKSSYEYGETIKIFGIVKDTGNQGVNASFVDIKIFNPNGNLVYSNTTQTNSTGHYNHSLVAEFIGTGTYSVNVTAYKTSYANATNSTTFNYTAVPPVITIYHVEGIEQLSDIQISATILDTSGTGINWTRINVTRPDGIVNQNNMTKVSEAGAQSNWTVWYNQTWGNTSLRGIYNVTVYSMDNSNNLGSSNSSFKVYANLIIASKTLFDYYQRGETASIYFKAQDARNVSLPNVNVSLNVTNPNGTRIFNGSYQTNSEGIIDPIPQFTITDDAILGNYTLSSFSCYFDPIVNMTTNKTSTFNFTVYEKVEFLTLDLEAPKEVAIPERLQVSAIVTDGRKNVDVDSAKASLYNPLGDIVVENVSMARADTGIYNISYNTSGWTQGTYKWVVRVMKGANTLIKEAFTRLVGGPFDVRNITVIDNTVPDLVISVIIENTGQAGQDVFVEWNLTRMDTGESLASSTDTIYIPALSTKTHTIYPSTNYIGEVKITFLVYYSGTERAGAYKTFSTAPEVIPPVAPPAVVPKISKLEIVSYPEEVEIERGWLGYANIKINNTGETVLYNIKATVTGIPLDWVEIDPEEIEFLVPKDSKEFRIKIAVPINAKSGNYPTKVRVFSNETSDEEIFIVRVFASRAELIFYQIQTLQEKLSSLENRTAKAEIEGKNVTLVKLILDEARERLRTAEDYLDKKMYDEASNFVRIARDLLAKAEYELSVAVPIKPPITIIQILQYWLLVIVGLLVAIVILIVYLLRRAKALERLKVQIPDLRNLVIGKRLISDLQKEKEKIEKFLSLLESEHLQGIISKESYEELKRKNEEKLAEIERKLGMR